MLDIVDDNDEAEFIALKARLSDKVEGLEDTDIRNLMKTFIPPEKRSRRTKFDIWLITRPRLATLFTAAVLATIWLMAWMFVLFWITYFTEAPTIAQVFIAGLLLSTCAEAVIRRVEISPRWERYSRGILHEGEAEVTAVWALMIIFGGLFTVAIMKDFVAFPTPVEFELRPLRDCDGDKDRFKALLREYGQCQKIPNLAKEWVGMFSKNSVMIWGVFWCWLLRVAIYQRPWKSRTWGLASRYMVAFAEYEEINKMNSKEPQ